MMQKWALQQSWNRRGFTIVELLIVVVVIAILAAITIVSYNGIQQRAKSTAILAAVDQWDKTFRSESIVKRSLSMTSYPVAPCVGTSTANFPAEDGFEEGECIQVFDGSGAKVATGGYIPEFFNGWPDEIKRQNGKLPTTTYKLGDLTYRARGVWVQSFHLPSSSLTLAWVPQVNGQCGRGVELVPNPAQPLSGGVCQLRIQY